jgi:anti-sigma factor RsiW
VSDPPDFGVPDAVVADDDDVELDDAAEAEVEELDFELPHAVTTAAIRNRQAAMAASLRKRMASLILGSPRLAQQLSRRCRRAESSVSRGSARPDVNTIVNDPALLSARITRSG